MLKKFNFLFLLLTFAFCCKCDLQNLQTYNKTSVEMDNINKESTAAFNQFFGINADGNRKLLSSSKLTIFEMEIFNSIISGKHVLARQQILTLYPNLTDFQRMRLIFENVYRKNQNNFLQLKNFALDCENAIISYNVFYVLFNIDDPSQSIGVVPFEDERIIEESLINKATKVIGTFILDTDKQNNMDIPNLVMKDLIKLNEKFPINNLLWKVTNELLDDHRNLIKQMSNLFDEFQSTQMSVVLARNYFFNYLMSTLKILDPEGSGKHMMVIEQGPVVLEVLDDDNINLLNIENATKSSRVYWHIKRTYYDFAHIIGDEKANGKNAYFCMKLVGNYHYEWYFERVDNENQLKCLWQLVPFNDGILMYNMGFNVYFCALIEDSLELTSAITIRTKADGDEILSNECVWKFDQKSFEK